MHHLVQTLEDFPNGPTVPKPLGSQIGQLRHLLEHWRKAEEVSGAWKGLVEHHGYYGSPWSVESDGSDLRIGADKISLQELEGFMTSVLGELLPEAEAGS
jgi:hypothetical protein